MENTIDPQQSATVHKCMIHYKSTKLALSEQLIKPANFDSWLTLLEAAKVRNHDCILKLAELSPESMNVPEVWYHRQCRSLFTMKRDLETLKTRNEMTSSDPGPSEDGSRSSKRKKTSTSTVYEKVCIFCQKTRYVKGTHSREAVILAVDLRSDKTLRDIAREKQDSHILTVTSRDIVAAEAHYHRSCYRDYTRNPSRQHHALKVEDMETDDSQYWDIEQRSYENLFDFIREEVIASPDIIALKSLTHKLIQIMQSFGVSTVKESTKNHIRRKLENEFGNSIHIFPDDKGRLIVMPDSMSIYDLAKRFQATKQELEMLKTKSSGDISIIDRASEIIRSSIKSMDNPVHWPYHPSNTSKESVIIPDEMRRFFNNLLTGNRTNMKSTSQKVDILIQSFSQDLIHAVTGGQYKPPKHIMLSYGVKSLTGNVELIQILNRLGHAISYSQLQENDTGLCLQKLAAANQGIILPENIHPYLFTNLAFDNIDRLEETLTGGGTTHCVNGIAVQPRVFGPHPPKKALPSVPKKKQRSVAVEDSPLQPYISGARTGPSPLTVAEVPAELHKEAAQTAHHKNLLWMLTRQVNTSNQIVPGWTGFNIFTRSMETVCQDVVGYLPTINAPATEMSTVLEILNQADQIRQELKLQQIIVTMDQALYAKATEILWKHDERYRHIIIRMGTFHTLMTILSILGKRFLDAGLRDICIESCLVVQGSVSGVVEGKAYNRAVRVHKCIYEGLLRIAWKGFLIWMEKNHARSVERVTALLTHVSQFHDEIGQHSFEILLEHDDLEHTALLWDEYLEYLRHDNGDLSAFWMSYLDIVGEILLGLIRASREGNWDLHMSAIQKLIPWCFAYDRVNYSRYLPVYLAQMNNLQRDHPEVKEQFDNGAFAVQLSDGNPFGRIPVDQTIEVTINKDTQTTGGTTKYSKKQGAVRRYYLTAEYRSGFLGHLRDMTQTNRSDVHHTELQNPRIQKDEKSVTAVTEVLNNWINPFEENHELVCISTATTARKDVRDALIEAHQKGKQAYSQFHEERLQSNPPQKKFHDPIPKLKLKTFSSMSQKKRTVTQGKTIILKTDRSLFGRIVVIAQSRNLEMKEVFCHPLGPLPWSLSTPDGTPRKTAKAVLAKQLQKLATPADGLPNNCNSATVIDAMSLVQKVKNDVSTFADVAAAIHNMICKEAMQSNRIDVVFDTYEEMSIKTVERTHRGEEQGLQLQQITATQLVKQWRAFLKQVTNKTSLIKFLVQEWQKTKYTEKLSGKVLFVTCRQTCWKISGNHCEEVPELISKHEEADGRLLLHAAHAAASGSSAVVICSEDTDVFILCVAFCERVGTQLFLKCGTQTRIHLIDINKICAAVGPDVCKALIGMHSFTGCDTVSAFAGKGKLRVLEILKKNSSVRETLTELGNSWAVSPELHTKLEEAVCLLYAPKPATTNVNLLRYHLFCARKGEIESHQLPPCKDSLKKHVQRANFQAAIWKRSLQADPETPSPVGNGWKLEGGSLEIDWMDGSPAPQAVLDLLSCKCSRSCRLPSCECLVNGLKCTDMCRLRDCDNQPSTEDSDTEDIEEDVESNDDDEDE